MEASRVLITAVMLSFCAVLFHLIGLASPYWVTEVIDGEETNSGLWRTCFEIVYEDESERILHVNACVDTKDIIRYGM
jgi:hypothetical protein